MTENILKIPPHLTGPFVYVDCGAQGDQSNSLLKVFAKSRYIGFDPEMSNTLVDHAPSSICFPVAVGRQSQTMKFHHTQNPNCSSFFIPNQAFLEHFVEIGPFFKITETRPLQIISLDELLKQNEIDNVDFLELDAQGSELDILHGAESLLTGILGVRVEVEFSEMYHKQPLFSDIDAHLRNRGFMLFNLDRYHLRRKSISSAVYSKEQIIWGQALYLRNYLYFSPSDTRENQKILKLATTASFYGFHSYAAEIVQYLLEKEALSPQEKIELQAAYNTYIEQLRRRGRLIGAILKMETLPAGRFVRGLGNFISRLAKAYAMLSSRRNYVWMD